MIWPRWLRRQPAPIDDALWRQVVDSSALFGALGASRLMVLRENAARFLADKRFHAAAGHVLDANQRLTIAAMACIPVHRLGYRALRGWRDVIVYPGGFRSRREHHDENTGVVTEIDEDMIGEAWERGPVVFSWADIAEDLASPFDGFNVVIHEIAHKLDMLDGSINGMPALPSAISRSDWITVMQQAFDAFVVAVERGDEVVIDPYAAESADEFFAVVSEYHHSAPQQLHRCMPTVAALLDRYYGPIGNP